MDISALRKCQGKDCSLICENNFHYNNISFIIEDGCVVFVDKNGDRQILDPSFVKLVTEREVT